MPKTPEEVLQHLKAKDYFYKRDGYYYVIALDEQELRDFIRETWAAALEHGAEEAELMKAHPLPGYHTVTLKNMAWNEALDKSRSTLKAEAAKARGKQS